VKKYCLLILSVACCSAVHAFTDSVFSLRFRDDVTVTIDYSFSASKRSTQIIIYALPNGNTTAQTMGKRIEEGDDWHFDIQHIKAQTCFIRQADTGTNYIVAYLENDMKSWPSWTNKYAGQKLTKKIIDTIYDVINIPFAWIHLNSHSGGGAFIFDYIKQGIYVSNKIKRISFIDSDYRYDSSYTPDIIEYVQRESSHCLNVFAYNDSIALLNGKTFVSATGGTWYRTRKMMRDLYPIFKFTEIKDGDLSWYQCYKNGIMNIFLLENPEKKILHTKQVELNGFIHSVFTGTPFENSGYKYLGERAYEKYIR
jgi:hypothetical protein